MSDERRLAVVYDYDGLLTVLRDRIQELRISYENLDDVAGLQSNYASQRVERKKPIRGGGKNEVVNFSVSRRRLGMLARKGGRARTEKMTPEQRSDSARKAVLARWQYRREKLARRRERKVANG